MLSSCFSLCIRLSTILCTRRMQAHQTSQHFHGFARPCYFLIHPVRKPSGPPSFSHPFPINGSEPWGEFHQRWPVLHVKELDLDADRPISGGSRECLAGPDPQLSPGVGAGPLGRQSPTPRAPSSASCSRRCEGSSSSAAHSSTAAFWGVSVVFVRQRSLTEL